MADEKTEEASPRQLTKAREEGDSGVSSYAAQAVAFLATVAVLPGAVRALAEGATRDIRETVARIGEGHVRVTVDPARIGLQVVALVVPVLLVAAVASAVTLVVQTGGFIATKKLAPDLSRLDPIAGARQLFSAARAFTVARALAAAALVTFIVVRGLSGHAADLARTSGQLPYAGRLAAVLARDLATDAAILGLFLGAVDLFVVRRAWHKRLRMTKAEVKREAKDSQGDPQIKAARARAQHEMLASSTVANVRTASVVVVNPTHLACALRYAGDEDDAPVVVASGEGELAARILRAAHEYGVPVVRNVPLARALHELEVGDPIPESLYEAVAEILREIWEEAEGQPGPD